MNQIFKKLKTTLNKIIQVLKPVGVTFIKGASLLLPAASFSTVFAAVVYIAMAVFHWQLIPPTVALEFVRFVWAILVVVFFFWLAVMDVTGKTK